MSIKHVAVSFVTTAVVIAVVFRVPALRKLVTGATA